MRLRLALLALVALAVLYAVVPESLWAQVVPGQLVTIGCGKVVSCEPLNVTGLNTPTPLPTCPAGQLLVGPGEPGSTCGTPQPTSTPRPTDTPIPADTPRPTDTPIPPVNTATREAQGFAFSTATPATGCIEAAVSIAQIDCVAPSTAITPAPTSTPRATDTPIPAVPTETPQATPTPELYLQATTATPGPGTFLEYPGTPGPAMWVTVAATATAVNTATPIPPANTATPIPAAPTATPELYLQATTSTPAPSTYLFYAGTPGPAVWVTPVPPTPRPTDTPIPAVNTATPIPAPTLAPTFAVGIIAEGNGGQGLQAGVAALTTATPIAAGFLYDSAGGAGSVLSFVTAVPTATIIATATPRATDTPIPTPTTIGSAGKVKNCQSNNVGATPASATTFTSISGGASGWTSAGETSRGVPFPIAVTITDEILSWSNTVGSSGPYTLALDKNVGTVTSVFSIANGTAAGTQTQTVSLAIAAGDSLVWKYGPSATGAPAVNGVTLCYTIP